MEAIPTGSSRLHQDSACKAKPLLPLLGHRRHTCTSLCLKTFLGYQPPRAVSVSPTGKFAQSQWVGALEHHGNSKAAGIFLVVKIA